MHYLDPSVVFSTPLTIPTEPQSWPPPFSPSRQGIQVGSTNYNRMIYIIGSLRNPYVPRIADNLRGLGVNAFDDWHAAGPEADDEWQKYEKFRGRSYRDALLGAHALDVFNFDKKHLDLSEAAIMIYPAGRSCHLEFGYIVGQKKPAYVLLDAEPERYDIMLNFATRIYMPDQVDTLLEDMRNVYGTHDTD